jgi:hypothetical protein
MYLTRNRGKVVNNLSQEKRGEILYCMSLSRKRGKIV